LQLPSNVHHPRLLLLRRMLLALRNHALRSGLLHLPAGNHRNLPLLLANSLHLTLLLLLLCLCGEELLLLTEFIQNILPSVVITRDFVKLFLIFRPLLRR
jgi:hypothetical protein